MAVYAKGIETKKRFILSTYHKLLVQDSSEISVRKLAEENGCSIAALYKHFESLDYLIAVASIRFLDEYMVEYVPAAGYLLPSVLGHRKFHFRKCFPGLF